MLVCSASCKTAHSSFTLTHSHSHTHTSPVSSASCSLTVCRPHKSWCRERGGDTDTPVHCTHTHTHTHTHSTSFLTRLFLSLPHLLLRLLRLLLLLLLLLSCLSHSVTLRVQLWVSWHRRHILGFMLTIQLISTFVFICVRIFSQGFTWCLRQTPWSFFNTLEPYTWTDKTAIDANVCPFTNKNWQSEETLLHSSSNDSPSAPFWVISWLLLAFLLPTWAQRTLQTSKGTNQCRFGVNTAFAPLTIQKQSRHRQRDMLTQAVKTALLSKAAPTCSSLKSHQCFPLSVW